MQKQLSSFNLRKLGMAATVALASLAFAGCTTTPGKSGGSAATQRADINAGVDSTLSRLEQSSPQARDLVSRAKGVLVFPSVLSAGFVVAAEHGRGALRVDGQNQGYYSTTGGSIGFQAGAQSKAVIVLFMTDAALRQFQESKGWTVGADATVAVANVGANGSIDSNTARKPVVGFVLNNSGLMAGVSLDGSKINRLDIK